jgi:Coenzyme A transferase
MPVAARLESAVVSAAEAVSGSSAAHHLPWADSVCVVCPAGNLVFRQSPRNFNPLAAVAGQITIAEVEHLVEPGEIDADAVHLPGIYVHRVLPLTPEQAADKHIERRTVQPKTARS